MENEVLQVCVPFHSFRVEMPEEWSGWEEWERQQFLYDIWAEKGLLPNFQYARAAVSAPTTHIGKRPSPSCEHVWHADGDYDRCDLCHGQKKREPL